MRMETQMLNHVYVDIIIMCVVFYRGKVTMTKANIISYGVNKMGDTNGIVPGIHAEHDAIRKLPKLRRNKRQQQISILVIRVSVKNRLLLSKPCCNCINIMKTIPEKKGYKIKNIYYSDDNGNIIKTNLDILDNEEKHYSRFYKKLKDK
jgi:hypothetical protein